MYYRKAYLNLRHHPKFIGLCRRLALRPAEVYGHLGMWWDYVGEVTGTLGVLTEEELAISFGPVGADWPEDPEPFRLGLLGFEFLHLADDGRYAVANWPRYCTAQDEESAEYLARKRAADAERQKKKRLADRADKLARTLVRQDKMPDAYGPDFGLTLRKKRRPKGYDLKGYFTEKGVEIPAEIAPEIEALDRHNLSRDSHNEPDPSRDSHNMSQKVTKTVTDASRDTPPSHNDRPRTEISPNGLISNNINEVSQTASADAKERDASRDVTAKSRVEERREEEEASAAGSAAKEAAAAARFLGVRFVERRTEKLGRKLDRDAGAAIGAMKHLLKNFTAEEIDKRQVAFFGSEIPWLRDDAKWSLRAFENKFHELEKGTLPDYTKPKGQGGQYGHINAGKELDTADDFA